MDHVLVEIVVTVSTAIVTCKRFFATKIRGNFYLCIIFSSSDFR